MTTAQYTNLISFSSSIADEEKLAKKRRKKKKLGINKTYIK